jgi:hypothetical protein
MMWGLGWCGIATLFGSLGFQAGPQTFTFALLLWGVYLLDRILCALQPPF